MADGTTPTKHASSTAKLKSVPRMLINEPDEEKRKYVLQTHKQFNNQLWGVPKERIMDDIQNSHPLRVEECAHLIYRFVQKNHVSEQQWESILTRCDIDPSVCKSEDGTAYNVLALDDEALLRLYVETPLHYGALLL